MFKHNDEVSFKAYDAVFDYFRVFKPTYDNEIKGTVITKMSDCPKQYVIKFSCGTDKHLAYVMEDKLTLVKQKKTKKVKTITILNLKFKKNEELNSWRYDGDFSVLLTTWGDSWECGIYSNSDPLSPCIMSVEGKTKKQAVINCYNKLDDLCMIYDCWQRT